MALAIRTLRDVYLRDLQRSEGTTKIVKSYRGTPWAAQLVRRQSFDGRLGRSLVSVEAEFNRKVRGWLQSVISITSMTFSKLYTSNYRSSGLNDHIFYMVVGAFIATFVYIFVCRFLHARIAVVSLCSKLGLLSQDVIQFIVLNKEYTLQCERSLLHNDDLV